MKVGRRCSIAVLAFAFSVAINFSLYKGSLFAADKIEILQSCQCLFASIDIIIFMNIYGFC